MAVSIERIRIYNGDGNPGHLRITADSREELEKALMRLYADYPPNPYGSRHIAPQGLTADFYHYGAD